MQKYETERNEQSVGVYIRDMDANHHAKFKSIASRHRRSMKGVVMALIQDLNNPGDGTGKDGYPPKVVNLTKLLKYYPKPK